MCYNGRAMNVFITFREMNKKLDQIIFALTRQEKRLMSALDDALKTLTDNDASLKTEVDQIVAYAAAQSANLASLQKALDDLNAAGVSPEALAAINKVSGDLQAQHDELVAALPSASA